MENYVSFDSAWRRLEPFCIPVSKIREIDEIIAENKGVFNTCWEVLKQFFTKGRVRGQSPLKGFLFEGPPGTGKTELAKQIARRTKDLKEEIYLLFIDGATIASPRWGDAEKTLEAVFSFHEYLKRKGVDDPKVIILFDDIESLMLARSSEIAKEWHFSINAILFHKLDELDASRNFVFATSNRPDLVDEALRDRLYPIEFKPPSIKSLLKIAKRILRDMGVPDFRHGRVLEAIEERLREKESPTIRDVERFAIVECVERGAWGS